MTFAHECQVITQHRKQGAGALPGHPSFSNLANLGACFSFRGLSSPPSTDSPQFPPPVPPKHQSRLRPTRGPSGTPGPKCRRLGCQARLCGGRRGQARPSGLLALCGTSAGDAGRARPRAASAPASARKGLGPGEAARAPVPQPVAPQPAASAGPAAAPQPQSPLGPGTLRAATGLSAGPTARCPGGPRAADPGTGRPPAACLPVPTAVPRPARPDPAAAPRQGRDSWVPKGLSRQRCGPSAPRAARPPLAGPSAHAPARYLRSRSRSSSTWPLSPGGRPSARPLGSAPRTLLATRTQPGEEGRGGDYHILAYQRASRDLSSQWSLWKAGIGLNTPRCCSGPEPVAMATAGRAGEWGGTGAQWPRGSISTT